MNSKAACLSILIDSSPSDAVKMLEALIAEMDMNSSTLLFRLVEFMSMRIDIVNLMRFYINALNTIKMPPEMIRAMLRSPYLTAIKMRTLNDREFDSVNDFNEYLKKRIDAENDEETLSLIKMHVELFDRLLSRRS